jgi:acetyl/propionyl-CoA carboxylase alpha subunit
VLNYKIVEINGRSVRVAVAQTPKGVWLGWPGGAAFYAKSADLQPTERTQESANIVFAPMTGRIVKVLVANGAKVQEGDLLAVMEAMKMEYRLVAPKEGVVQSVSCQAGELVDLGAKLVDIAPSESNS